MSVTLPYLDTVCRQCVMQSRVKRFRCQAPLCPHRPNAARLLLTWRNVHGQRYRRRLRDRRHLIYRLRSAAGPRHAT